MIEQWKPVVGFGAFYEISSYGRIKSLRTGRQMNPYKKGRYYRVMLHRPQWERQVFVHVLVLEAFRGPRPDGKEAAHLNGSPLHNQLDNLDWVTPKENNFHKRAHGTHGEGEKHSTVKLTTEKVYEIFALWESGITCTDIARQYGVSRSMISLIIRGKGWKHLNLIAKTV